MELGGTIGDIEGMPFVEAFRQFQFRVKKENFCVAHVSLVPQVRSFLFKYNFGKLDVHLILNLMINFDNIENNIACSSNIVLILRPMLIKNFF